ncbi:conserved hypothetical protein [Ricinus communis]|uniref:Uncharacterized protein n=1 Tax=Ricinus communis TaxID=3988 RepID=B9SJD6_RICCO|nr:conserved hypothetical protein [Ricinus communis]
MRHWARSGVYSSAGFFIVLPPARGLSMEKSSRSILGCPSQPTKSLTTRDIMHNPSSICHYHLSTSVTKNISIKTGTV